MKFLVFLHPETQEVRMQAVEPIAKKGPEVCLPMAVFQSRLTPRMTGPAFRTDTLECLDWRPNVALWHHQGFRSQGFVAIRRGSPRSIRRALTLLVATCENTPEDVGSPSAPNYQALTALADALREAKGLPKIDRRLAPLPKDLRLTRGRIPVSRYNF